MVHTVEGHNNALLQQKQIDVLLLMVISNNKYHIIKYMYKCVCEDSDHDTTDNIH